MGKHTYTFLSRRMQRCGLEVQPYRVRCSTILQINGDDFMEHYYKRSNIEATNAAIKRKFGETLKSKNPVAQVNELLAKIIA